MQRDYHDLWGGAVLAATGAAVALYCLGNYDFGSLRQMGPGFFPVVLGVILTLLGVLIALPAWFRAGKAAPFAALDALAVLAAIAVFAFGLGRLGLILFDRLGDPDRQPGRAASGLAVAGGSDRGCHRADMADLQAGAADDRAPLAGDLRWQAGTG